MRRRWDEFPDVVIATTREIAVKQHAEYAAAKSGNALAAFRLVQTFVTNEYVERLRALASSGDFPRLTAVHAEEATGRNQIAQALAAEVAERLELRSDDDMVQINIVNHTGAGGFARMARQALFSGTVVAGVQYLLVDDFVGQGGTLANFRAYIQSQGGRVLGATVLTGKTFSAKIMLSPTTKQALVEKHGQQLEDWWEHKFGFDFSGLTESEARYLLRTQDADTVRNQIAAAG